MINHGIKQKQCLQLEIKTVGILNEVASASVIWLIHSMVHSFWLICDVHSSNDIIYQAEITCEGGEEFSEFLE